MSYFNHAYRKSFLSTKATQEGSGTAKAVQAGFLTASGVHSRYLSNTSAPYSLGVGTFGFFDPATYKSVALADSIVTNGKPLVLAGSAILPNDKIGPFHGGYNESNKSKMINPKYIHRFLKQEAQDAEQNIVQVGKGATTLVITTAGTGFTNGTVSAGATTTAGAGTGLTLDLVISGGIVVSAKVHDYGIGYATGDVVTYTEGLNTATFTLTVAAACSFEFLSGETYNLQLNLWGSPVLRLLNHDAYRMYSYNSGCSADVVPTAIDSTIAMIYFAKQILSDKYVNSFVLPTVITEAGELLSTEAEFDAYVSSGHTTGRLASLILTGAYVETKFGNCSFVKSDFFEKEIVRIKVSLVDLGGDPCTFASLCINEIQPGLQAVGFGETVLRDVILDESYLQNVFADDVRIREITQGESYLSAVNRNALYDRYVILHSVPRYNNPSGVYDNDQYALNIYVPSGLSATAFENFMVAWLGGANVPVALEVFN